MKTIIKSILATLIILCATSNSAEAQLLWKVSKTGQPDSYIFGTHHLIPQSFLNDKPEVEKAYQASDVVIGEINISEMSNPISMQYYMMAMAMPKDSALNIILSFQEYEMLVEGLKQYSLPIPQQALNGMRPAAITTIIAATVSGQAVQKLFPGESTQQPIDFLFQQKATKDGKKIFGLETLRFQTDLLLKSKGFKETMDDLLKFIDCSKTVDMVQKAMELTESYVKEDLYKLLEYTKDNVTCPNVKMSQKDLDAMINDRNTQWCKLLSSKYLTKQTNFIAVGALHLPGEKGLINLLQKEGYKVEAVR